MPDSIDARLDKKYEAGFTTNVESETLPPGLDENVIGKISQIKNEPQWLLDFRLKAYQRWKLLKDPDWANLEIQPIDYQAISYYSAPKKAPASYDEVENSYMIVDDVRFYAKRNHNLFFVCQSFAELIDACRYFWS